MEKCLARIQLWLPETTYQDALVEAADRDQAAHRCDEERKP